MAIIKAVISSVNRALQLDAVLRSFYIQCQDMDRVQINALYLATDHVHIRQHRELIEAYPNVSFLFQGDFRRNLLSILSPYPSGSTAEKIILSTILTLEHFGYYSLAVTLNEQLQMVNTQIARPLFPRFSALISLDDRESLRELYHKSCQLVSVIILPIAGTAAFFSRELIYLWIQDMQIASIVAPIATLLFAGIALLNMTDVPFSLTIAYDWVKFMFYRSLVLPTLVVLLMIMFSLRYAWIDAALAWVLLNLGQLIILPMIIHHRILKDKLHRRHIFDVGIPLISSPALLSFARWLMPLNLSFTQNITTIGLIASIIFGVVVLSTGEARVWGLKILGNYFQKRTRIIIQQEFLMRIKVNWKDRLAHWLGGFGFDVFAFRRGVKGFPQILQDYKQFQSQHTSLEKFPIRFSYPCPGDRFEEAGVASGHYFHQDLLVAQKIFEHSPVRHVDVGSRFDGFVAHVASFREIEVLDIRPITNKVKNVVFHQFDLTGHANAFEAYCDSLSCLHTLEHLGLGRYGDRIMTDGYLKGFRALWSILKSGGILYLSVPIGLQRIEFNAHRVFSIKTILDIAQDWYELVDFSYVDDLGDLHKSISLTDSAIHSSFDCWYGCGIFDFRKR